MALAVQAVPVGSWQAAVSDAPALDSGFHLLYELTDRLHLTRVEESHEEIVHRTDVLDIEDEPGRQSLCDVHSVQSLASQVIDLLKLQYLTCLHLIGHEVFAALTSLQASQSVGVHN